MCAELPFATGLCVEVSLTLHPIDQAVGLNVWHGMCVHLFTNVCVHVCTCMNVCTRMSVNIHMYVVVYTLCE